MADGGVTRLFDSFMQQEPSSAIAVIEEAKRSGIPQDGLFDALFVPAVAMLGAAWASGEVDEIAFTQAAVVAEQLTSFVTPALTAPATGVTIVIGCAVHEHHDINKNIVASALKQAGHRVVDLGVSVRASGFLEKAEETGAPIVIICAEMMATAASVAGVRQALDAAGHRNTVLLVAGGPFAADRSLARGAGANGVIRGASSALRMVERVVKDRIAAGEGAK